MTEDNARKKKIRARMKVTGEPYCVAGHHLENPVGQDETIPAAQHSQVPDTGKGGGMPMQLRAWPDKPAPVDPGNGSRADRQRMLQLMRRTWGAVNAGRRDKVIAEVRTARGRQAEVAEYWTHHKVAVKERWKNRTGRLTVADIPEVAAQWHPGNLGSPEEAAAMAQQRGTDSPYRWLCPLGFGHPPWGAWPKDRIQSGTGCPACQKLAKLGDVPMLSQQYAGADPSEQVPLASHDKVPWVCRTWALDPDTGDWDPVEHHFDAVVKGRSQQGHGCRVCAGFVIDDTNSFARWFPELAEQLDDSSLDPRYLPTSSHNSGRRDDPSDHYSKFRWRCRQGHRWGSTILNRVQGGDCPKCSTSGISKEQVKLVAELSCLMELVEPEDPDPRLPDGAPDFASHRITIPLRLKPSHWRYRAVEVDARFRLPSHNVVIGVEYDGIYHHSAVLRERSQHEAEKSTVLHQAEVLDAVVHVRVGNLPAINAPHAISVPVTDKSSAHERACAVSAAIESRYPGSIPALTEYRASGQERGQTQADAYIVAVWGQLRPPRPKRERTAPPKQRQLRVTDPHPDSMLVPIGDSYRNPERPAEIIRDYRCACGTPLVTAVQSQVTSGNTRSCGCLKDRVKQQSRRAVPRSETGAVREWARQHGIPLNGNGRVPDQVVASYRLAEAGRTWRCGPDGLLEEKYLREWAAIKGLPMGARGRVPSGLWLKFADYLMAQQEPE